jgi:hypothetical protein
MRNSTKITAALLAGSILAGGSVRAMAQDPDSKPKPAAREYPPLIDANTGDQDTSTDQQSTNSLNPDTVPLTGVQIPTLGSPGIRHSYWIPGFQYTNLVQSTSLNQAVPSGWNSTNYLVGSVSLLEAWSRSQLAVNYSGGGSISTDQGQGNNDYQQLGVVQSFEWQRWQLVLIDQFSYLSQSQFGFAAATNLATPGVGGSLEPALPGLQTSYQPAQTIFTSIGPRYSNSADAQVAYALSRRASVTLVGSYGILRFSDVGSIDTNNSIFSGGLSYELSPKDTIGFLYRFSAYRYIGAPQGINDQVAEVAYGRKVTGKLAFQLFGGPDRTTFRVPVNNSTSQISGAGGANLTYGLSRSTVSLTYSHGVSGGSGEFTGSTADQLQAGIIFPLSRLWQANLAFGYARNKSLGISVPSQLSEAFDSWYIGGGLARPIGRNANFTLGYAAYIQNSDVPICVAGICETSHLEQQISIGFQWHTRPLVLR